MLLSVLTLQNNARKQKANATDMSVIIIIIIKASVVKYCACVIKYILIWQHTHYLLKRDTSECE
jgi:predicted transglutaminase-like protease